MEPPPEAPRAAPAADRLSAGVKAAYAVGGLGDTFGHWLYASLARPVFNLHLGLSPTLVGTVLMVVRLAEACGDPLFGWLSDNTRSRWGRRRPYILAGSVLAGLALPALFLASGSWSASEPWMRNAVFWFMLVSALLYTPLIGLYSVPYGSLGSELTPDYHERTGVMAWKAVVQKGAWVFVAAAWWLAQVCGRDGATGELDILAGARWVAAIGGGGMIVAGVVAFARVRERYYGAARTQPRTRFWRTCGEVFRSRAAVLLLGAIILAAAGMAVGNDLGLYAGTFHVLGGDKLAMARYQFIAGGAQLVLGLAGVALATLVSRRHGKRTALLGAIGLGIGAYGASWWLFRPGWPVLMVLDLALGAMASTAMWVLVASMGADLVDDDEARVGQRREGAFNSWFSWAIKIVLALCLFASGAIVEATGFAATSPAQPDEVILRLRLALVALPVLALALAGGLVAYYPLTAARMQALRATLEARRGKV